MFNSTLWPLDIISVFSPPSSDPDVFTGWNTLDIRVRLTIFVLLAISETVYNNTRATRPVDHAWS